jgi:hypothetical protein
MHPTWLNLLTAAVTIIYPTVVALLFLRAQRFPATRGRWFWPHHLFNRQMYAAEGQKPLSQAIGFLFYGGLVFLLLWLWGLIA